MGSGPSSSHNIVANGPTVSLPHSKFALTSHLGQNVGLGEGWLGSFPESYTDPRTTVASVSIRIHESANFAKRKSSVNVDVAYV